MSKALAIPTQTAIARLENIIEIRSSWIDAKRQELATAEEAARTLLQVEGMSDFRIKRANARVRLLRKVVDALERGFVPLPRFSSRKLDVAIEELPVKALAALAEAQAEKIFDEIRFVPGDVGESRRGVRRRAARDPLLVGVVRVPGMQIPGSDRGWGPEWLPGQEEHFLIAWWRPDEETPEVMF